MKLDNEPRLQGVGPTLMEWARKVAQSVNALIDAIGIVRAGATPISQAIDGPAFRGYLSANAASVTQGAALSIPFNAELFDTANCYAHTTGVFQPNVAGYYHLAGSLYLIGDTALLTNCQLVLYKNGAVEKVMALEAGGGTGSFWTHSGSAMVYMNGSTDTTNLGFFVIATSGTAQIVGGIACTNFSGHLARRA